MKTFTLQDLIAALAKLTIGATYKYASAGRVSTGTCQLVSVDSRTGSIQYRRNSIGPIDESTRIEHITGANVAKLAIALGSRKAIEINALYGGSGNFRSALEGLVANTENVFVCQIDGKKHIFWTPDRSHPVGVISMAEPPAVYGASTNATASVQLDNAPRQLITYGAPGSGKSWRVKAATAGASVIRTTFHPDSDYSTFVGAYKPSMKTVPRTMMAGETIKRVTNGDAALLTEEKIAYTFVPQAFVKAYVQAWKFKAEANGGAATRQYLVIEEINRGNCAQIFGDLFQLLDRNDVGFSEYEVMADDDLRRHLAGQFADLARANAQTPLALGIEADLARRVLSGEALLLPDNLYIWATMNTSDQSLFPIDSAFKRRWEWKYMPIYDADRDYRIVVGETSYKWWDFLEKANALVQEFTDSEDKKLGYFFCKAGADGAIPLETFVGKVVFYLWNDVFKDVGFDHEAFAAEDGGRLLFKAFFNPDGSPNVASVRRLMENLGVAEA